MSEPPSTCPPTAQPSTTPTSRPSTTVSSAGENSPKSPLPPQCGNSSSSRTPSCEKIDSGSPDTLDSHHRCSSGPSGHLLPQGEKGLPPSEYRSERLQSMIRAARTLFPSAGPVK